MSSNWVNTKQLASTLQMSEIELSHLLNQSVPLSQVDSKCSDPKKLDTKVPLLILASVLAVEPANSAQIRQG